MSTNKEPEYTGPPEYESLILPNLRNQRAYLASIAEDLTHEELGERAAEAGIDLTGARSKTQAVERVREAVRPEVLTPPAE